MSFFFYPYLCFYCPEPSARGQTFKQSDQGGMNVSLWCFNFTLMLLMSYFEAIGIVKDFTGERQASDDLLGDDEDPLEHFLL